MSDEVTVGIAGDDQLGALKSQVDRLTGIIAALNSAAAADQQWCDLQESEIGRLSRIIREIHRVALHEHLTPINQPILKIIERAGNE